MADLPPALPVRDGVGPSRHHCAHDTATGLLAYLDARFPDVGSAVWQRRLAAGEVRGDDGSPLRADSLCRGGDCLWYYREVEGEPEVPGTVDILHEDDHLLVVDKPHFLSVMPGGRHLHETVITRLRRAGGRDQLVPLHRIDRETAGLVMLSRRPESRDAYVALFRERSLHKTYEVVAGDRPGLAQAHRHRSRLVPGTPFYRTAEVEGEANSETLITRLHGDGQRALYRAEPVTGRKHQIRVHFAALGLPILHDKLYPSVRFEAADDFSQPLQLLARELAFRDPLSGDWRRFTSRRRLACAPERPA